MASPKRDLMRLAMRRQLRRMNISQLPVIYNESPWRDIPLLIFMLVGVLIFTLAGCSLAVFLALTREDDPLMVFPELVFAVPMAAGAFAGLIMMMPLLRYALGWRQISIDERTVTVSGSRGEKAWSAPLVSYKGMRLKTRVAEDRTAWGLISLFLLEQPRERTVYMLELSHEDPDRWLVVYESFNKQNVEDRREPYARVLGLPPTAPG